MAVEEVKISELPPAGSLVGLKTLGMDKDNKSVSVPLTWLKEASDDLSALKKNAAEATVDANKAADAANKAKEEADTKMSQISKDASVAIKAATDAAGNAQEAADNVKDGKTPVLESVNAESGALPAGSFSGNGVDESGNPKYILNLTLPSGKDGQPAVFEQGTTTTLEPTEEARVEVVENGETAEGNPKYILNFFIPRGPIGKPGTGSGNVSADGTGLVTGKKYLFVPNADGSTAGKFVEYEAPEIPEQVQPDWDATEGKGSILHKPTIPTKTSQLTNDDGFITKNDDTFVKKAGDVFTGNIKVATAANSNLQFDVKEIPIGSVGANETDVFLYNLIRNGSLKYTSDGELLFEGKKVWHEGNDGADSGLDADLLANIKSTGYPAFRGYVDDFDAINTNSIYHYDIYSTGSPKEGTHGMVLTLFNSTNPSIAGTKSVWVSQLTFGTDDTMYYRRRTNDSNWTIWRQIPFINDDLYLATTTKNGFLKATDKKKLDRIGSFTTATTVANLDVNYETIDVTLAANASLSVNAVGASYNGLGIHVVVFCPSARTITIPTTGNYRSMCGSSYACPAGKRVEFHLKCISGVWLIAKLEEE